MFVRRLPAHGAWRIRLPDLPAGYFCAATAQSSLDRRGSLSRRAAPASHADAARERSWSTRAECAHPPAYHRCAVAQWRQQGFGWAEPPRSAEIDRGEAPAWLAADFLRRLGALPVEARRRPSPPRLPSYCTRARRQSARSTLRQPTNLTARRRLKVSGYTSPRRMPRGCSNLYAGKSAAGKSLHRKPLSAAGRHRRSQPTRPMRRSRQSPTPRSLRSTSAAIHRATSCAGEGEHVLSCPLGASCVVAGQRVAEPRWSCPSRLTPRSIRGPARSSFASAAPAGATRRCHLLGPNRCGWRRAFPRCGTKMSGHCRSASSCARLHGRTVCAARRWGRHSQPFRLRVLRQEQVIAVAWPALRPLLSSNGRRCFIGGAPRLVAAGDWRGDHPGPAPGPFTLVSDRASCGPLCCADRGADGSPTVTSQGPEFVCKPSLPRRHCPLPLRLLCRTEGARGLAAQSGICGASDPCRPSPPRAHFCHRDPLVARYQESECTPAPPLA